MVNILRNLRIDEISSVDRGAGEGARIVLMKRDTTARQRHDTPQPYLFNQVMARKAAETIPPRTEQPGDKNNQRVQDDDKKLSDRLKEAVAAMVAIRPSLNPAHAAKWLLHTEHGQSLLNLTKSEKELPMQIDVFKLSNIESVNEICRHISKGAADISEFEFSQMVLGHAKLNKRAGESDAAAFSRIFQAPENIQLRRAHNICKGYLDREPSEHLLAVVDEYRRKGMASLEPVSTEVGSSEFDDDSAAAVKQLQDLAEKQHRTFEEVFLDRANSKLAQATYPRRNPDFHSAATK
jgi:hypothetical protein